MLKIPVILFHDIASTPRPGLRRWTISPDKFRQHLDAIAGFRRVPLTISELADCLRGEHRLDQEAIAVTFDDGYASTRESVLELRRLGIKSTVYVATGTIGAEGMLSAPEIKELADLDGVEIGSHSVSHPHLDELADDVLEEEVTESKHVLEMVLDAPVASFAYPYGSHDRRTRAAVIRAGYRSAAAIKDAISYLEDDPFAIARWTVTASTSPERLARVVGGEGAPIAWSRERLRTRGSRAARRGRRRLLTWASGRQG
jgi:peptidoglycan/xylan/chitin deacetylase (PgdA/CDA1 family)